MTSEINQLPLTRIAAFVDDDLLDWKGEKWMGWELERIGEDEKTIYENQCHSSHWCVKTKKKNFICKSYLRRILHDFFDQRTGDRRWIIHRRTGIDFNQPNFQILVQHEIITKEFESSEVRKFEKVLWCVMLIASWECLWGK